MIARIEVGSNNLYATSVNPSDDRLCLYLAGGQFLSQLLPLLTGRCEVTCLEPVHVVHALLVRLLGVSAVISCWDSFSAHLQLTRASMACSSVAQIKAQISRGVAIYD